MGETAHGRWAFGLTSAAVLWAAALLPAAFVVPVYGTSSSTLVIRAGGGYVTKVQNGSATLIGVNGASFHLLMLLALPAALTGIAWIGLHQTCTRGRLSGRRIATVATVVLAVLTLLTGFSIGAEMLPALMLLMVGGAMTPTWMPPAAG